MKKQFDNESFRNSISVKKFREVRSFDKPTVHVYADRNNKIGYTHVNVYA